MSLEMGGITLGMEPDASAEARRQKVREVAQRYYQTNKAQIFAKQAARLSLMSDDELDRIVADIEGACSPAACSTMSKILHEVRGDVDLAPSEAGDACCEWSDLPGTLWVDVDPTGQVTTFCRAGNSIEPDERAWPTWVEAAAYLIQRRRSLAGGDIVPMTDPIEAACRAFVEHPVCEECWDDLPPAARIAVRLGMEAALAPWKAEMLAAIDLIIQGYDPKRHCYAITAANEMLDRAREARAKLLPPETPHV